MSTTPFALQLAHNYNLKKLLESKIMHASGSYMNLCHLHVTYQCTSKHPGEERREAGEKEVHIHWRQVCFAEIIFNFFTHCTDTWYLVNTWSELFKRSIKLSSEYWAQLFKSCMDSTVHWKTLYPVDKYQGNQLHFPLDWDLSGPGCSNVGQRYPPDKALSSG